MTPYLSVTGPAVVLDEDDIDTDIIFPARFLLLLDKKGLGRHAFHERRQGGRFILDQPPFDRARHLIAGRNFGGGSSREQAVWALADFGIRTVLAESFGEIFYNNCFRNGLLPIVATAAALDPLRAVARQGDAVCVDLDARRITAEGLDPMPFEVEDYRRAALMRGLDEIGGILTEDADDIRAFEEEQRRRAPWLWLDRGRLAHFDDLGKEDAIE